MVIQCNKFSTILCLLFDVKPKWRAIVFRNSSSKIVYSLEASDIADKITVSSFVQKQTSVNKVAEIEAKYEVKIQKPKPAMPEVEQLKMLSVIIEEINAQYGVNYEKDVATKSALQIRDLLLKDERLKASAKSNSLADFRFAYEDSVSDALVNGYEQNVDFYTLLLGNAEIRERITNVFMEEIYRILRGEK
jgi:type I restriction enzyme R subunit